jgi:hypothetical protein
MLILIAQAFYSYVHSMPRYNPTIRLTIGTTPWVTVFASQILPPMALAAHPSG